MAHWAEIDKNNIVVRVTVGNNNEPDEGYQWLIDNLGGTWVKTSYNSRGGKRYHPETNQLVEGVGFRKNYAVISGTYDSTRDAFIPPRPIEYDEDNNLIDDGWVLNEDTCLWELPPVQAD